MRVNKDRIRVRFARAAATYDSQASIQLRVAETLLSLLREHVVSPPRRMLEIGCCTGLLTAGVHNLFANVEKFYVNDLVPDFQDRIQERLGNAPALEYLAGDIEQLDMPGNLDLVVSSSTLHWLEDLPSLFSKIGESLAPGGHVCFSIYGPHNLAELRKITGIGLDYMSLADLESLLSDRFEILSCEEERITLHFDDGMSLLNHLRKTGVNCLDTVPWTRSRLAAFIHDYTKLFGSNGNVALTYHPIYCIARKTL